MKKSFTYPIDEAAFIEYQQSLVEGSLNDSELQVLGIAVQMINSAFKAGKKQAPKVWPTSMDDIIQFFVERGETKFLTHSPIVRFFSSLIYWMDDAYETGIKSNKVTNYEKSRGN